MENMKMRLTHEDGSIPTKAKPFQFDLEGGGSVDLRRLPQHVIDAIMCEAGKIAQDEDGRAMMISQLTCRVGIINCHGLKDFEGNDLSYPKKPEKIAGAGLAASKDIYSAVSENVQDKIRIMAICTGNTDYLDEHEGMGGDGETDEEKLDESFAD